MTVSDDFTGLTGQFRGVLAHCYRMLGLATEAEDLVPGEVLAGLAVV
jgi:hypothetical protein